MTHHSSSFTETDLLKLGHHQDAMHLADINELTKAAYNATAEKYHLAFHDEVAQKPFDRSLLDRFSGSLPKGSLLLDAGCGPSAHIGRYLHERGHRVIGIDLSECCVEIARRENPGMEFHVMDMMHTTFADGSYDGVVAFYSLLYTPRQWAGEMFREFGRILRPGGRILIAVKKGEPEGVVNDEWYEGRTVYFTHFLETDLFEYCRQTGFVVDSMETRKPYSFEIPVDRIYMIATKPLEAPGNINDA